MKEIEVLKNNWQKQKPAAGDKFNYEEITSASFSRLKKFEKRILKINIVKTAGIIIAITLFIWSMLFELPVSAFRIIAVIIIVIGISMFWLKYLRLQLKTAKLNVRENSLDFIDDVLKNFSEQREFFRKDFKVFGVLLLTSINIIYLDLLTDLPVLERIGFHVLMSAVLIAVIFFGVKFRMRRFKKENEPIENELIKMKEDLKE